MHLGKFAPDSAPTKEIGIGAPCGAPIPITLWKCRCESKGFSKPAIVDAAELSQRAQQLKPYQDQESEQNKPALRLQGCHLK